MVRECEVCGGDLDDRSTGHGIGVCALDARTARVLVWLQDHPGEHSFRAICDSLSRYSSTDLYEALRELGDRGDVLALPSRGGVTWTAEVRR